MTKTSGALLAAISNLYADLCITVCINYYAAQCAAKSCCQTAVVHGKHCSWPPLFWYFQEVFGVILMKKDILNETRPRV